MPDPYRYLRSDMPVPHVGDPSGCPRCSRYLERYAPDVSGHNGLWTDRRYPQHFWACQGCGHLCDPEMYIADRTNPEDWEYTRFPKKVHTRCAKPFVDPAWFTPPPPGWTASALSSAYGTARGEAQEATEAEGHLWLGDYARAGSGPGQGAPGEGPQDLEGHGGLSLPSISDLVNINKAAIDDQLANHPERPCGGHKLIHPEVAHDALDRASEAWERTHDPVDVLAWMGHRLSQGTHPWEVDEDDPRVSEIKPYQAFADANHRTAIVAMRDTARANGWEHLVSDPEDVKLGNALMRSRDMAPAKHFGHIRDLLRKRQRHFEQGRTSAIEDHLSPRMVRDAADPPCMVPSCRGRYRPVKDWGDEWSGRCDECGDKKMVDKAFYPGSFGRTSSWVDVRMKGKRLRDSGAVTIIRIDKGIVVAQVRGDHGVYDTEIYRQSPGEEGVTIWSCTCGWGNWAFKRQHTYVGRLCSHALATLYEVQSLENRKRSPHYRGPSQFRNPDRTVERRERRRQKGGVHTPWSGGTVNSYVNTAALAAKPKSPPAVGYHFAFPAERASIAEHGLDWRKSLDVNESESDIMHPGNYLWESVEHGAPQEAPGMDVWEVDATGLGLEPDPWRHYDRSYQHAWRSIDTIGPERLRLVQRGTNPTVRNRTQLAAAERPRQVHGKPFKAAPNVGAWSDCVACGQMIDEGEEVVGYWAPYARKSEWAHTRCLSGKEAHCGECEDDLKEPEEREPRDPRLSDPEMAEA